MVYPILYRVFYWQFIFQNAILEMIILYTIRNIEKVYGF